MFKCAVCGCENLYPTPSNCRKCGAKLYESKHELLRHVDFLRKELESEEISSLIPPDVRARVLAHYEARRDKLINALREPPPLPKEVAFEEKPPQEKVAAAPAESPEEAKPVAIPPEVLTREPERAPVRSEPPVFQPDFAKWGETIMRSLLYLGVAGLICAFLLFIYGPKYAIPPTVKLGVLLLITAGIYIFGHVLRHKFDLARTGLALIFLALALVPLLYLAAKRFGVLPADHTILEWIRVTLFCTILYAVAAVIVGESALMYLTTIAGATTTGLLMAHLGWFESRRFVEIAFVSTLLSTLYFLISTYTSQKRRDAMPFLVASQMLMGLVLLTLAYYTVQSRFVPAGTVCAMITAYYAAAYFMRRVEKVAYIPCVSLVATIILFTLSRTTDIVWLSVAMTVPASIYLFLGAYPRIPDKILPKLPLRQSSFGLMLVVLGWSLIAILMSVADSSYLRAVYMGLMVTGYFIPSALVRDRPNEAYIPCISLVATVVLLTLSRTTDIVWLSLAVTVPASVYLFLGAYRRIPDEMLFKLPLRQTSFGAMIAVLVLFVTAVGASLVEGTYLRAAYIGLMVTGYFIPSALVRAKPDEAYIPCISLMATVVLLTLSRTTDIVWLSLAVTVPASVYLFLGAYRRIPDEMLFKLPLRQTSLGAMTAVLFLFVVAATRSLVDDSYLRGAYIGLMVTAYFVASALARAKPQEMYVPAVTFIVTALLVLARFMPDRYNLSPGWFCVSVVLAGGGYVLTKLNRETYARPFYGASYWFSLVPFSIAMVGLALRLAASVSELTAENPAWLHAPTIAAGLLIAAAYYTCCAYAAKEPLNMYLSVGAVTGLIALVVNASALPGPATFMFWAVFALALTVSSLKKQDALWSSPFHWSSHVIAAVNMVYVVWIVATDIAGRYPERAPVFPLVTSCAATAFYLYNALERKQKLWAYLTVIAGYLAIGVILFTGLGASYVQVRLAVAVVSLAVVGLEYRLRNMDGDLWTEPLLAVRNVVVGAVVAVGFVAHARAAHVGGNAVALYAVAALTAVATAFTRRDEPGQRPQVYTFVGGALSFVALWTFLHDVVGVSGQTLPFYVIAASVPYLAAGRVLERVEDKTHSWAVYSLATLIAAFAIIISLPYQTSAIFTCIGASVAYGILAYFTRKDLFLYASILSFGLAYWFCLLQIGVPVHAYGLYFVVLGLILALAGRLVKSDTARLEENPFYVVGAVISVGAIISAVVLASLFLAGKYSVSEVNIAIAVTVVAAVMYATYGFFLSSRTFFVLSSAMLVGTYYLLMLKYHVTVSPAYTFPPAAMLAGLGIAQIRSTTTPAYPTGREKITAGLLLLFVPAFVKTVANEDFLEGLLIMVLGISVLYLSTKLKIRALFVGGAIAVGGDIFLQAVRFMRSATIPRELYIGTGSVILIFMGCLAERRFKEAVAGTVRRTKGKIAAYFEGWT